MAGITTIFHAVLALFAIIELGLMAYVVNATITPWGNFTPSSFSFMLFNGIWSLLVLAYLALTPIFLPKIFSAIAALVLLVITSIFWFAGSIAMAAFIGVPQCNGNTFCQSLEAAVAFGFFTWAAWTALTVLEGLAASKGGIMRFKKGTTDAAAAAAAVADPAVAV